MKTRTIALSRVVLLLLMGHFTLGVWAQDRPSTGDFPLAVGEASLVDKVPPPSRVVETTQEYLRASLLPMNTPDGPVRILFEKAVDLAVLQANPGDLEVSAGGPRGVLAGTWTWESFTELRFTPAAGSLRVGDYLAFDARGKLPLKEKSKALPFQVQSNFQVENFQMGTKVGEDPVVPGQPRFVSFLDSHTGVIGEGPLYLLYDQTVDPAVVALSLGVRFGGSVLKVQVRRPLALPFDRLGIYHLEQVVAVTFLSLPPDNSEVEVSYPATLGPNGETSQQSFSIDTSFQWSSRDWEDLRSGRAARLSSDWNLGLSGLFDPSAFEEAFSISPRPPVLRITYGYGESSVRIHAEFDAGKLYSLKIAPSFTDMVGNHLAQAPSFAFKSQDLPPVLDVPDYSLLLETGSNRIPLKYRNLKDLIVAARVFPDTASFVRALSRNDTRFQGLKDLPPVKVSLSDNGLNTLYQSDVGMGLQTGLKLVEVQGTGRGTEAAGLVSKHLLVQTTNLGITAKVSDGEVFAWVTRLDNTSPVASAKILLLDETGTVLAEGVTASNGTARLNSALARGSQLDQPLFLSAQLEGDLSVCRLVNEELSGAWQFNLPGAVKGSSPLAAALFTERGAYRPGETVHVKAFFRDLPEYRGLGGATLIIHDPRGQEAFNQDKNLDLFRGSSWDFPLVAGAAVGEYSLILSLGDYTVSKTFRVEEYRVPTFQVAVSTPDKEWLVDKPLTLSATATYLKGGVLAGQPLQWRIYRQPEDFLPPGFPGYRFTLDRDLSASGSVFDQEVTLDSKGTSVVTFTPSQPDSFGPMLYSAQAAATDTDRQNYAGRVSQVVHATDLYVGARPPAKAVFRTGEKLVFPVVVTEPSGKVLPGKSVTVFLDSLSWDQNTLLDDQGHANTYNRTVTGTKELGTFVSGPAAQDFTVAFDAAGAFRIRLTTADRKGRTASTDFPVTVTGENTVAWPRFDRERIDLVLDKKAYKAGDLATLVPQSPFPVARGLLTVEANGVLDTYPFEVTKNTPSITFPVKASYAPNAYVSVVLLRGRTHYSKDATGFETGAPAYRIGYSRLEVDPSGQRLAVKVGHDGMTALPGREVTVDFSVALASGQASEASAAVMVVDEAVLGLTGFKTPDPVALAYDFRVLSVRNASNLLDLPHSRRARYEALFPGGDSDGSDNLAATDDVLRRLFKSTAFFSPAVPVGADGKGLVTFKLPDNLTTYRVMVVAANKRGQMGSSQASLLTRKSLSVEAVAPRFVYEDDALVLQARVFNGTDQDGTAEVSARFDGLTLLDPAQAKVVVPHGSSATVDYRVKVGAGGNPVRIRMAAVLGSAKDAIEISLPLRTRGNKKVLVGNGIVSGSGKVSLVLPPGHRSEAFEVVLSSTPLSELKDAVQYLMGYPNGCIEQTTSTAYPLVVLKDLLPAIGIQVNQNDLKNFAEAGVARILSFQTSAGGLSYWPGGTQPHAFATAFGLTCLIEAKKRGYNVPDQALKEMGDFLEKTLASGGPITGEMPHASIADADTRALFVMTLGRLGRPQSSYMAQLWAAKDKLTPFGLAFLGVAARESKADQALVGPVLAALKTQAVDKKEEAYYDAQAKGGWSLDSPLRTDAGGLMAFASAGTDPGMAQRVLTGLLHRRQGGLWGNTQENVFGIMGIYQLVSAGGRGTPVMGEVSVTLAGAKYPLSAFSKNSLGVLTLSVPGAGLGKIGDTIDLEVAGAEGTSYYATLRASFEVPVDAKLLAPEANGFTYQRRYEALAGQSLSGKEIPLGSLVRVRLLVHNPDARHYVAVDDLLPGGLEPLNTALKTTEAVDLGAPNPAVLAGLGVLSYQEMRDHRVAFYADEMLPGDYEFVYVARATTPGTFFLPAGRTEAMYAPDQYGTSGGGLVVIR